MKLYRNTRNEKRAELLDRRDDGATMRLLETGEEIEVGIPTFKRWWKPVDTEAADIEVPAANTNSIDPVYKDEPIPAKPASADKSEKNISTEPQDISVESENAGSEDSKPDENAVSTETQAAPMKLSEIVTKLEDLFDILNQLYFEAELARPVITVQSTPRAYGHCSTKQIWKSETEAMYEINIGAEFLNRPSENTAATMLHEMVHLYCRMNDIDETCQNGRYHNKIFKTECEARDLAIDYDRANGYTHTTPTEIFKDKLRKAGFELTIPFARHMITKKKANSERAKAHKYVCPICGQTIRSTSELNIVCGDCEVPFTCLD